MATNLYEDLGSFNPYASIYGAGSSTPATGGAAFANPIATAAANAPVPGTDAWTTSTGTDLRTPTTGLGSNGWGIQPPGSNKSGFGWNLGTMDLVFKGLGTIAQIWNAWEQTKIAKDTLAAQKQMANINIANQVKALNTQYTDVAYNRDKSGGWTTEQTDTWLNNAKLPTTRIT